MFNPPDKDKALAAVAFSDGKFDGERPAYYLRQEFIDLIHEQKDTYLRYAMGEGAPAFTHGEIAAYDIPQRNLEETFQAAVKLVRRGRVIPFVGSGLSVQSGYKTWVNCLRHLARGMPFYTEMTELISEKEFEGAASLINRNISDARFRQKIDSEFDKRRVPTPKGCVLHITKIASGAVITTNFDTVIKRTFELGKSPFEQEVFGTNCDHETAREIINGERILLKIHGEIKASASRVFTKEEYDEAYGAGGFDMSKPLPKVLGRLFQNQTLLFLGCSLESDRTLDLFKFLVDNDPDGERAFQRHYAVLEAPENIEEIYDREQFLSERQIFPIWFPYGDYDRFNAIIECLADDYFQ